MKSLVLLLGLSSLPSLVSGAGTVGAVAFYSDRSRQKQRILGSDIDVAYPHLATVENKQIYVKA